jgi:hypothetical protein
MLSMLSVTFGVVLIVIIFQYTMRTCTQCKPEGFGNPFDECVARLSFPAFAQDTAAYKANLNAVITQYADNSRFTSSQTTNSLLRPACMF